MRIKLTNGSTLIELLIVVAIIGILAAVGTAVIPNLLNNTKVTVVKSNHTSMIKDLKFRLAWCDMGNTVFNYSPNYSGTGGYIDCRYATWSFTGQMADYFKTYYKNPWGLVNGAWDYGAVFVDRNQIPTSCGSKQLGYAFLTSFDKPAYFKLGSCYKVGEAPMISTVYKE